MQRQIIFYLSIHFLIATFGQLAAHAEEEFFLGVPGLTNSVTLTSDIFGNVSGGTERGAKVLNNLDVIFDLDTEKAGFWQHGKIHTYLLADWGGGLNGFTEALQANDNIDSPDTVKLYEAYYEHEFCDAAYSVLFGLHNYNAEFDVPEYGGVFIHSSFGIEPANSQIGPSIFPTTSLAIRVKAQPTEELYLLGAVYDGVPGDPSNEKGTHLILRSSDGLYWAGEVGMHSPEDNTDGNRYKVGVGGWYSTAEFSDYLDEDRDMNHGVYLTADKSLFSEQDSEQGLGVFLQAGLAKSDRNQIGEFVGGGLAYRGAIPERDDDILGLGFAHARTSDDYRRFDSESKSSETAFELTYRAEITPWLAIQPDLQYIVSPGAVKGVSDAWLVGLRIQGSY